MLTHTTNERLIALGLTGMAKAFEEQRRSPDLDALSFEERIGLPVDRAAAERDTKRLHLCVKIGARRRGFASGTAVAWPSYLQMTMRYDYLTTNDLGICAAVLNTRHR